jgi:aminopeptidase-like protein
MNHMNINIKKIVEQIHPFRRMINSRGMDKAFDIVKSYLPDLIVHEYFPGEAADDWEVPFGWELIRAHIKNAKGEIMASDFDSHLLVAAYSEPTHGKFDKEEIAKHLRCHPVRKDEFFMEHRNAYNYSLVDWGITLPQNLWDNLPNEEYEVLIEVEKDYGRSMKVGETFIEGKSKKIVCFTAHIDELCNDNLSSCAVLIELFRQLKNNQDFTPEYSYQLLLIPEVIGTYFYIKNNPETVKNTISMINLETVGRGESWLIKQSFKADNYIDKLMVVAAKNILKEYLLTNMFGGYGNDERVYEFPTINIPSVALQRFPFDEYHSSADTPDKLSDDHLSKALDFVAYLIEMIEKDFIPEYNLILPPWLTRHGLYFDSKDQPELFEIFMNQIQFNINGKNSIVDLCFKFNIPFEKVHNYLRQFVLKKFINPKPTYDIWKN